MYDIIDAELKQPLFENFQQLESAVLSADKHASLSAALTLCLRCNDIGEAFSISYRCALQALLPELDQQTWAAMCVSEKDGNHPKTLKAIVEKTCDEAGEEIGKVSGHKSFITMADQAKQLIVIAKDSASSDDASTQPTLKAVLVQQPSEGLSIELMPPLPMVPNVRHGQISFENVAGKLLPGDGYADYSKRFRTLEDAHVFMGFTAMMLRKAIDLKLDAQFVEECLLLINGLLSLQALSNKAEKEQWFHLILAACFNHFEGLCHGFEEALKESGADFYDLWKRDKKLFTIAAKARVSRNNKAQEWLKERF